jgi:hypothetical protein
MRKTALALGRVATAGRNGRRAEGDSPQTFARTGTARQPLVDRQLSRPNSCHEAVGVRGIVQRNLRPGEKPRDIAAESRSLW